MEKFEISEKDSKLLELIEKLVADGVAIGIKKRIRSGKKSRKTDVRY